MHSFEVVALIVRLMWDYQSRLKVFMSSHVYIFLLRLDPLVCNVLVNLIVTGQLLLTCWSCLPEQMPIEDHPASNSHVIVEKKHKLLRLLLPC